MADNHGTQISGIYFLGRTPLCGPLHCGRTPYSVQQLLDPSMCGDPLCAVPHAYGSMLHVSSSSQVWIYSQIQSERASAALG